MPTGQLHCLSPSGLLKVRVSSPPLLSNYALSSKGNELRISLGVLPAALLPPRAFALGEAHALFKTPTLRTLGLNMFLMMLKIGIQSNIKTQNKI